MASNLVVFAANFLYKRYSVISKDAANLFPVILHLLTLSVHSESHHGREGVILHEVFLGGIEALAAENIVETQGNRIIQES